MTGKIGCGWALLAAWLVSVGTVLAQEERRELEFEEVPSNIIVPVVPGDAAVLVVESTISPLSFDSRGGGIRTVRETEPGTYQIVLAPDVHYIEIRAEGFMMLRLPRWNFPPKSGRRVRVRAKATGLGSLVEHPQLRLSYAPGRGEEVYVQLDQHPPQKMDFSPGGITLRPSPGARTVKVYAGGRLWERTLTLEAGQRYEETVSMEAGVAEALAIRQPGNLAIESTPAGAQVYLNQVEQPGVTPLTIRDLQPGVYQLEVLLAHHRPAVQQVEVRELDYAQVELELIPHYATVEIRSTPSGALLYLGDRVLADIACLWRRS